MKKGSIFCVTFLFLLWILLLPLYAKEFHVSSSEEFQDALYEAASNGESDRVYLAAGTYKGNFYFEPSEEELSAEWISLEIYGQKDVVIEGSLSFDNIITWQPSSGIGYYINLENFKIIGGITVSGFGSANFSHLKVENGSIYFESAIPEYGTSYPYGESLSISNCEIFNSNSSAIYILVFNDYVWTYIEENVIKDNNGNGITISGWPSGNIFIEHNIIENNQGNGISVDGALYVEISDNKITFNKSSGIKIEDSGLYCHPGCYGDPEDPGIYIEGNLVAYNSAVRGGGIQLCDCQAFPAAVTHNIIVKNKAQNDGGGVYISNSTTYFVNNTITANTANQNGGGIAATNYSYSSFIYSYSIIEYFNNIVWGNEASNMADDIYHTENIYCDLFNNDYHDFIRKCQIQSSNIDADPLFVDLNSDDYHLSSNSPCIDAGTSETPLPWAMIHFVGFAPDIGAYESQVYPPNNPPTITSISQSQSDGTQIPEEGIILEGTIVFKATLEDPDGDDVRLEIELRKIGEPFTGEPTSETISDFVPSGSEVAITRSGLVDGDYHWQYRVKDSKGTVSEWKEFGETGNVDFKTRSLLSRYAPVFYLYFDDFRPRSIESMLDNADLWKWNNVVDVLIDNCANLLMLGPVEANQLLKHNHGNCFLDLWWAQNENVCGGTVTPNVGSFWEKYKNVVYGRYYEPSDYHSNVVLQYWFFYVYNNWHDYGGLNNHEGDWEMVQVILDKKTKEPTYVTYSHHVLNDHTTLEWKNVSKVGTHPEVFVARGSHASYPSPGVHCILGETKIGNKIISLCDILKDKYRRKLQDQTTGVETILYPERDYKIICLNNYSWPSWEGRWGKRVKELKNGNCLRSGKCGPLSPGKQKRKWNHPLEWALFSIPRIVAVVASPVHLHVYDQRGNHVGLTPEGLIEADIPETLAYYPLGDEGKLVAISTAEPLTYKIKGYEKGTFDFVLYKFLEENKVVMVSYEEVPVDENTTAILNSTSDNPNFLMDIDINNDGEADYQLRPDSVTGVTGDLDHDGDIDRNDLNIILSYRNQEAGQYPECDLDNDGVITVLDARKLVLMCTRPRCEAEVIE